MKERIKQLQQQQQQTLNKISGTQFDTAKNNFEVNIIIIQYNQRINHQ